MRQREGAALAAEMPSGARRDRAPRALIEAVAGGQVESYRRGCSRRIQRTSPARKGSRRVDQGRLAPGGRLLADAATSPKRSRACAATSRVPRRRRGAAARSASASIFFQELNGRRTHPVEIHDVAIKESALAIRPRVEKLRERCRMSNESTARSHARRGSADGHLFVISRRRAAAKAH